MKEELIIKILDKASEFLNDDQVRQLRNVIDIEIYNYEVTPACHSLVPINNKSAELLSLYLASKKQEGLSPETLKGYKRHLRKFIYFTQKNIENIEQMDCRRYLAMYSNEGIKNSTLGTITTILKSFFGWLSANSYIVKSPLLLIKTPKTEKYLRDALTTAELESLRFTCKTLRDRAMVEFFYSTACRLDEFYKLNKSDINWLDESLIVFGKGKKERKVFLTPAAILHLKNYLDSRKDTNEALFVGERKVKGKYRRLGRRAIQRAFDLLGEKMKLNRELYPHLMRHTLATHMLMRGASLVEVQKYLGHESPSTTQIYAKLDMESLRMSFRQNAA